MQNENKKVSRPSHLYKFWEDSDCEYRSIICWKLEKYIQMHSYKSDILLSIF